MKRLQRLPMALRGIRTRKMRAALTTIAVLIGVASVVVVSTLGASFEESIAGEFQGLDARSVFVAASYGTPTNGPPDAGQFGTIFTEHDRERLAALDHVETVVPEGSLQVTGIVHNERETPLRTLTATTAADPLLQDEANYAQGGPFQDGAHEIVLGDTIHRALAAEQSVQAGDAVEILLPGGGSVNATLAGILRPQDTLFGRTNDQAFVPIDPFYTVQTRRPGTDETAPVYDGFTVIATDVARLHNVQSAVREAMDSGSDADSLRAEDVDILVFTRSDVTDQVRSSFDRATLLIAAIAATSLFVAGIMIATVMLINVTERTRVIGLMKTVGAKDRDVKWIFLLEAGMIAAAGSVLGTAAGLGLGVGLVRSVFSGALPLVVPWSWVVTALVVGTLTGLVAGVLPARRATRVQPVQALGYE